MKLEIIDFEDSDPVLLAACIGRIRRFYADSKTPPLVQIRVFRPESDGTLCYAIVLPYSKGGQIVVHAIRRHCESEVEFHS